MQAKANDVQGVANSPKEHGMANGAVADDVPKVQASAKDVQRRTNDKLSMLLRDKSNDESWRCRHGCVRQWQECFDVIHSTA